MYNLPALARLPSLSEVITGIENPPGGASRLVLHGMGEEQRRKVLSWAQDLQDSTAAYMW
jgi:hypothetical protein